MFIDDNTLASPPATSVVVGSILTANTLRGSRTRLALAGCIAVSIGSVFFLATHIATSGLRFSFAVASTYGTNPDQVDEVLTIASSAFLVALVLLVVGGSCLAVGIDDSGASSWFTSATWSVSLVSYGLVAGVWWAEAITASAIALTLLVIGRNLASVQSPYVAGVAARHTAFALV